MTDYSLNRWPVLESGDPRLVTGTVPGTSRQITCHVEALPLFLHFAAAWNAEMPARLKLTVAANPVDSWEVRQSRTGGGYSNHSSATALDLCYNILLADHQLHMTPAERGVLARILARYTTADGHAVLANGYAWKPGAYADEMHTELSQGWDTGNGAKRYTSIADVREVIKRIGIRKDGTVAVKPVVIIPKPTVLPPFTRVLKLGDSGLDVLAVQRGLRAGGNTMVKESGTYDPITKERMRMTQLRHPLWLEWGGNCGPKSYKNVAKPV